MKVSSTVELGTDSTEDPNKHRIENNYTLKVRDITVVLALC